MNPAILGKNERNETGKGDNLNNLNRISARSIESKNQFRNKKVNQYKCVCVCVIVCVCVWEGCLKAVLRQPNICPRCVCLYARGLQKRRAVTGR